MITDNNESGALGREPRRGKFSPLLKAGWEVIPLASDGDKRPLVSGFHGEGHAVADEVTVKGWAKKYPTCNPAIVMPEGVVGLDVDNHDADGLVALAEFERRYGALPVGPRIFHGYTEDGAPSPYGTRLFRIPEAVLDRFGPKMIVGNLGKIAGPGVDVIAPWLRYNVAPGAVHKSGEVYEWAIGDEPVVGLPMPSPADVPSLTVAQAEALLTRRAKTASKPLVAAQTPLTAKERGNRLLGQVADLAALDEHETLLIEGQERGWQIGSGFFTLACALLRVCRDTDTDPAKIKARFLKAAARAEEVYGFDIEREWENAVLRVEEDEDDFAVGGVEEPYPVPINGLPVRFAKEYVRRTYDATGRALIYRDDPERFYVWGEDGPHYAPRTEAALRHEMDKRLDGATEIVMGDKGPEVQRIALRPKHYGDLLASMAPSQYVTTPLASGGVPFLDGWVEADSGLLVPHSPERFTTFTVKATYADVLAAGARPTRLLAELARVQMCPECQRTLQQWCGYVLSGSTRWQKFLLQYGPPGSLKGITQKLLQVVLGSGAVGIDLPDLSSRFGLATADGARLLTVDDARFSGEARLDPATVSALATLTSFGKRKVEHKHKDGASKVLPALLMVASNQTFRLPEDSTAITGRMLVVQTHKGFRGTPEEDPDVEAAILAEVPEFVGWALEGWADLQRTGRFHECPEAEEFKARSAASGSSVRRCLEECFDFGPDLRCSLVRAYNVYQAWHEQEVVPGASGRGKDPMGRTTFNSGVSDTHMPGVQHRKSLKVDWTQHGEKQAQPRGQKTTKDGWIGMAPKPEWAEKARRLERY